MSRFSVLFFMALLWISCGDSKPEAPARQQTAASTAAVSFHLGDRDVSFARLEAEQTELLIDDHHATIRVAERGSNRMLMVGFRNVDTSEGIAGSFAPMTGEPSANPQVTINALNCTNGAGDHVTFRQGMVRVDHINAENGHVKMTFDGMGYSLKDHMEQHPIPMRGTLDLDMDNVRDQRTK